jgi:hypothetical protein
MGNFYANIAVKTQDQKAIVAYLKHCRQTAYVSSTVGDFTFVFAECFLDPRELESLQRSSPRNSIVLRL